MLFISDITESYNTKQKLEHSEKVRTIGQFVSSITHGLGNNMTNVISNTQGITEEIRECGKYLFQALDLLDENMHRRTLFYPICYKKGEMLCPRVIALVIKDALVFTNKALKDSDMEVYSASGSSLINSVKENLDKYEENNLKFGFIVSCCARLEALGDATFKVHKIINNYYKNIPFLLFFASGEDVYKSGQTPVRLNESFNVVNFY